MMEYTKILFEYTSSITNNYEIESAWALPVGKYYQLDNILFYAPEYKSGRNR
ncbi:MAG: hypothetical protein ACKVTZ_20905 [Bacteroidia bacterium]